MSKESDKLTVAEYLSKYQLQNIIEEAVNMCFKTNSNEPLVFFLDYFKKKTQTTEIEKVVARQVLDSRGNPTIEVDIIVNGKVIGRASSPSGASTGAREACELRDENDEDYQGKSVNKAVEKVNVNINDLLRGNKLDLLEMDKLIEEKDGTTTMKNFGGNATTAVSFSLAYAGAHLNQEELFIYLAKQFGTNMEGKKFFLPQPMVNIINGGKHAGSNLKIQEFMIVPRKDVKFSKALKMVTETYHCLKELLVEKKGKSSKNVGDEGGFAPDIQNPDEALTFLEDAITKAGYKVGEDIFLALDAAANEFSEPEGDEMPKKYEVIKGKKYSSRDLVKFYEDLVQKHPALISIEDGFHENDFEGWKLFTERMGDKIMIVGDDLYTTNPEMIRKGLENKWANALLLKVNQIGTIRKAMESAAMVMKEKQNVIVSHRSGETSTSLISDLAVAIGAKFIKTGAPARGERVVKYNRLLQIEEFLENHQMLMDPKEKS